MLKGSPERAHTDKQIIAPTNHSGSLHPYGCRSAFDLGRRDVVARPRVVDLSQRSPRPLSPASSMPRANVEGDNGRNTQAKDLGPARSAPHHAYLAARLFQGLRPYRSCCVLNATQCLAPTMRSLPIGIKTNAASAARRAAVSWQARVGPRHSSDEWLGHS